MEIIIDIDEENPLSGTREYTISCPHGTLIIRGQDTGDSVDIWLVHDHGILAGSAVPIPGKTAVSPALRHLHEKADYLKSMYPLVRRALPLVRAFPDHQTKILELVVRLGVPALELLEDIPALTWLLVTKTRQTPPLDLYWQRMERLVSMKRHIILAILGCPAEKWFVRLLRKIPAGECCNLLMQQLFLIVRKAEQGDRVARYKVSLLSHHVNWINRLQIDIFNQDSILAMLAPSFFEEIGQLRRLLNWESIFDDLVEIRRILDQGIVEDKKEPVLRTLSDVLTVHTHLVDLLSCIQTLENHRDTPFPAPPFAGITGSGKYEGSAIVPISNGKALWQEGRTMHHCIFSYLPSILEREEGMYVYHVSMEDDEQATLLLMVHETDGPRVSELRGPCNDTVSPSLERFVDEWLRTVQAQWRSSVKKNRSVGSSS